MADSSNPSDPNAPRTGDDNQERAGSRSRGSNGNVIGGWDAFVNHIKDHKIEFTIAITRTFTILFTISYLYIACVLGKPQNRYKQTLLVTAATSCLRLHLRMPPPPLSQMDRNFLTNLVKEDTFHYLCYPILFLFNEPITLVLLPCCLYAFHNLAVYVITILDKIGGHESLRVRISTMLTKYQQSLLHTIALCEISLMPMLVAGVFTGAVGLMMPLLYFRFLLLRYNSARNAHFKLLVSQIWTVTQSYASRYYG